MFKKSKELNRLRRRAAFCAATLDEQGRHAEARAVRWAILDSEAAGAPPPTKPPVKPPKAEPEPDMRPAVQQLRGMVQGICDATDERVYSATFTWTEELNGAAVLTVEVESRG